MDKLDRMVYLLGKYQHTTLLFATFDFTHGVQMAELKTQETADSVTYFLDAISDKARRDECDKLLKMMQTASKSEPRMWGPSIIGFGNLHNDYETGREGDWFIMGFSPRKQSLTLYLMAGFDTSAELFAKLGIYKTGKGCLYIKSLADIDMKVLKAIMAQAYKEAQKMNKPAKKN
jgi:hypothetical protein